MADPATSEPRGGLLIPDFDDLSKEWQAKLDALIAALTEQSEAWQAKVDRLTGLVEELLFEIRALRGVTVTIDRTPGAGSL